jgi:hypothetical protein
MRDPTGLDMTFDDPCEEDPQWCIQGEPEWMRERRLRALEIFWQKPMPTWGGDLSELNFDEIYYYVRPDDKKATDWDDVPEYIRKTFDRLGIPEAERKFLAGVGAQYESEVVYHNLQKKWEEMGVIFVDTDTAVQKYPDLVKEYFGETFTTDHNLYIKEDYVYQSNYVSGLRILDIRDPENPQEVGFFDTVPWSEGPGFNGSWSNYPFFESGTIVVSSMKEGVFFLKKRQPELVP